MNDIVLEARTYIGVPWVHQGRSRDGVDCLGLAILVAQTVRGYQFDMRDYAAQAMDETMQAKCLEHMDPIGLSDLAPGNVVVIKFENQRHMAIVGDYPIAGHFSLIHANSKLGKVVEHRLDSVWRRLIMSAWALRDLRGND
jgi:cell wall-associated NlpC family hydrolase